MCEVCLVKGYLYEGKNEQRANIQASVLMTASVSVTAKTIIVNLWLRVRSMLQMLHCMLKGALNIRPQM